MVKVIFSISETSATMIVADVTVQLGRAAKSRKASAGDHPAATMAAFNALRMVSSK